MTTATLEAESVKVRFTKDHRSRLTANDYYTAGMVAAFDPATAAALIEQGQAVAAEPDALANAPAELGPAATIAAQVAARQAPSRPVPPPAVVDPLAGRDSFIASITGRGVEAVREHQIEAEHQANVRLLAVRLLAVLPRFEAWLDQQEGKQA